MRVPSVAPALVLSCAVHAVPLLGPHAAFLVGAVLWRGVLRPPTDVRSLPLQWGAVLLAQALLFSTLVVLRRAPRLWQGIAFAVAWVASAVALNAAFQVAIPVATLIEPEARAERIDLSEVCSLPAASLYAWSVPAELAQHGEALLRPHPGGDLRLLRMPGCRSEATAIPENVSALSVRSGGRALLGLRPPAATHTVWLLTDGSARHDVEISGWEDRFGPPVLLADGRTIGFVRPRQSPGGYRASEPPWAFLELLDTGTGKRREIPITGELGRHRLIDGAGLDGRFLLLRESDTRSFLTLDAQGQTVGSEVAPQPGVALSAAHDQFVWRADGWLGWDVYTEPPRRCSVAWRLPAGAGQVEIPRGSCVISAAVDPGGRYVAYSTSSALSVGSTRDSVVVVRVADGAELFRRSFPKYHRSEVVLLGDAPWLGLTDVQDASPLVRVYALPPP
jgi:hypothetical protein